VGVCLCVGWVQLGSKTVSKRINLKKMLDFDY